MSYSLQTKTRPYTDDFFAMNIIAFQVMLGASLVICSTYKMLFIIANAQQSKIEYDISSIKVNYFL